MSEQTTFIRALNRQELEDLHECVKERMNGLAETLAKVMSERERTEAQAEVTVPPDWRSLLIDNINQKGERLQRVDEAVCKAMAEVSRG